MSECVCCMNTLTRGIFLAREGEIGDFTKIGGGGGGGGAMPSTRLGLSHAWNNERHWHLEGLGTKWE